MTFIISPVIFPTLLSCLFQLVSNLLFHFLRQNATVRDFLVIHQVFVEVSEIQSVELNFLQLINRNPPTVRMLRTAKTDTQLSVAPLLLDYLRQLRIKLTVTAFFSRQTPSTFFEQNSPTLTVSLFDFALARAFSSLLHLASPISCPQPLSLQQLLYPAAAFLQNFA